MATNKQIEANKNNARLSTGARTAEGKAIISKNSVKHGIFTKDLIISGGDGKEIEKDYNELLANLIENLNPQGQFESLLVEKIAVDFWRLKRVLRFETGSIRRFLDNVVAKFFEKTDWHGEKLNTPDLELDKEIIERTEIIDWNNRYIQCLKKGAVDFEKSTWVGSGLESDIKEDLHFIIDMNKDSILSGEELVRFEENEIDFEEMKEILKRTGFVKVRISNTIMERLKEQNSECEQRIDALKQQKLKNNDAIEVEKLVSNLPPIDNSEKIIRYEKALQKSIFQNLVVLKKLQSLA